MPLVGPREHERASAAAAECRAELPVEDCGLTRLAVSPAVEPDLAEQERAVTRQVVQAGQIGAQAVGGLEIDVEAHEIHERELEVFGRRVVDVRDERAGIDLAHFVGESLDEPLDPARTVPANHRSRDLVADGIAEDGRMAGAQGGGHANACGDRPGTAPIVEEGDVLLPGQADQHLDAVTVRRIEEPPGRYRVGADRVDTILGHRFEVAGDGRHTAVLVARGIGPERAIRDAANPDLVVAAEKEAAPDVRPLQRRSGPHSLGTIPIRGSRPWFSEFGHFLSGRRPATERDPALRTVLTGTPRANRCDISPASWKCGRERVARTIVTIEVRENLDPQRSCVCTP